MQPFPRKAIPLFLLVLWLGALWPGFQTAVDAIDRAHGFHLTADEALHTEVVEVLAQTGNYSNWAGQFFVPHLTTGPTVILPAAFLTRISGLPSGVSGRITLLAYFLGSLVILASLARRPGGPPQEILWSCGLALGLYHYGYRGLQDSQYYIYGVMGEGAGAFYLLLCTAMLTRNRFMGAGVSASLAFFSKPFFIFVFPVVLSVSALQGRRNLTRTLLGLALPWGLWMSWTAFSLGIPETWNYWTHYYSTMRSVNGARDPQKFGQRLPTTDAT